MKNEENMPLLGDVCAKLDPFPVCALLIDGVPIHPPGVNERSGHVSVAQNFGGVTIDRDSYRHIVQSFGPAYAQEIIHECSPYSRGTRRGFLTRCLKQLGRKCVQITDSYPTPAFHAMIDRALPVKTQNLPNWGNALDAQMDILKTSFSSSAGAPYWRAKADSVDLMQNAVLPLVLDHIMSATLGDLFKRQPELWLCHLKNKADRYKDPTEKTRPYLSLPWHWQALFSCLSQPYCESLKLFYEQPGCRNAYGFSYAHGGGNKLRQHVLKELETKTYTFFVYGDDVDFYYKSNGKIYRICPDFSQMDGSIDQATISLTIDHILMKFAEVHGTDNLRFWEVVASQWKHFATRPFMLVDGETIWRKKQSDGLLTGVVGTTLFDTVKAVAAYERFVEHLRLHPSFLEEKAAKEWFRTQGLEIKAGTWSPQLVNTEPQDGALWTDQKFLGMQLMYKKRGEEFILVPVLPKEDWLALYLTPRREELGSSALSRQRYTFDRMRGLLTTGAAFDSDVQRLFNGVMRTLDPLAIVMQVQAGEGGGSLPELVKAVGEDFRFNTSMGWPTEEWVLDLYAETKLKVEMAPVFTCGEEPFRKAYSRPQVKLDVKVVDRVTTFEPTEALLVAYETPATFSVPLDHSLLVEKKEEKLPEVPHKRSEIKDLTGKEPPKVLPRLTETILKHLQPRKMYTPKTVAQALQFRPALEDPTELLPTDRTPYDDWDAFWQVAEFIGTYHPNLFRQEDWGVLFASMVWPLKRLAAIIGIAPERLESEVLSMGFLVLGPPNNKFITNKSWSGVPDMFVHQARRQEAKIQEKLDLVRKELKTATVEKVTDLKLRAKALEQNAARAKEAPAIAVVTDPPNLKRLVKVPNFDPTPGAPPQQLAAQANTILKFNKLTVRLREKQTDTGTIREFLVSDKGVERPYMAWARPSKEAWILFYQSVVVRYIRDTQTPKKNDNWAEFMDKVDQTMVVLYKDSLGPLFLQKKGHPLKLLREHPKIDLVEGPNGPLMHVATQTGNVQVISLTKGTIKSRVARLEKLFGDKFQTEHTPLKDLPDKLKLYEKKPPKDAPKEERKQGRSDIGAQKAPIKPTEGRPQPKVTQAERDNVGPSSPPRQRQRFLRGNPDQVYRPRWGPQRPGRGKSRGLDRNKGPARGPAVAKVEANQPPA